eukprot:762635-Hanusia_phi.AAC.4
MNRLQSWGYGRLEGAKCVFRLLKKSLFNDRGSDVCTQEAGQIGSRDVINWSYKTGQVVRYRRI